MVRTTLTYKQKQKLTAHHRENPGIRHQDLACWALAEFGKSIGRSTVTRILATPLPLACNVDMRRSRRQQFPDMEQQLVEFTALHQESNALSDLVLWEKANELIHPKQVSFSWVQKFKRRYGIRLRQAHGESGSVDLAEIEQRRAELRDLLEAYAPEDVFNFDETGLYYRMLPSQSLATGRLRGKKKDKSRITVGLGCNMAGTEKLDPVIIHTSKQPRCFRGVNVDQLGVHYVSNKKAWMTRALFLEWLHGLNLKMHDRKILLLLDNASSHADIDLANVRVCFLPPNTTSHLQPLDAGIIRSFKCKYKKSLVRWVIDQLDSDGTVGRMDVLTAIKFAVDAWKEVSENTIRNCWCHTGIVPAPIEAALKSSNDPRDAGDLPELSALIRHLKLDDPLDADVYVDVEDARGDETLAADKEGDDPCESEEDVEEERPFSHREALGACQQLAVYAFSQNKSGQEIASLMKHAREMLLAAMKQQKITEFLVDNEQ